MSENLRHALFRARLQPVDVAAALGVDPKTVDRWLKGRVPYPRHRWAVAELVKVNEADLWPDVISRGMIADEVQAVYPHRWAVPQAEWHELFAAATFKIDILTYSALFLAEDARILRRLSERAGAGVEVRILVGHPDSAQAVARGEEEGIGGDVMVGRIRNAIRLFEPLRAVEGIEIRQHKTTLYNSLYRADADLIVNMHAYGVSAAEAPVLRLTINGAEGAASTYLASFEKTWATSSAV
ncbi:hypothetical protein [Herbidospora cretacea]|uniref:hypothetical protein n=1 Tax=Herbidospora cretacea TaxID=28444 RepID=UPI0007733845|nr:hypothetical protein [Herbidospora cretacea]